MFMFVALMLGPGMQSHMDTTMLERVAGLMFLVLMPTAFVIRKVAYRASSTDGNITIGAYAAGNIIFWAMCEGVAFFGLVITMLAGKAGLAFAIAVAAMIVQILNFPTGGPLQDSNAG
jgi:O-antigen ligase